MILAHSLRTRRGFTLVELMVAAALCVFIMYILSYAFQKGTDTMATLKSVGDMQEQLRAVATILKRDLAAEHFDEGIPGIHGKYLSQQRLDKPEWVPPEEGFFRIWQGSAVPLSLATYQASLMGYPSGSDRWGGYYLIESVDTDGIPSYLATDQALHFTVRLKGQGLENLFATDLTPQLTGLPPVTPGPPVSGAAMGLLGLNPPELRPLLPSGLDLPIMYSKWAEVAYFLVPNGQRANGNIPLFTLYRRQALLVDGTPPTPAPFPAAHDIEVSRVPPAVSPILTTPPPVNAYNTPNTINIPERRWIRMNNFPQERLLTSSAIGQWRYERLEEVDPTNVNVRGNDILLTNVLSFEIKAAGRGNSTLHRPPDSEWPRPLVSGNPDYPFDDLPPMDYNSRFDLLSGPRVFDTWTRQNANATYSGWPNYSPNTVWDPLATGFSRNTNALPYRIRIEALQIRIRIWDEKTKSARQITIIQDV